MDDVVINQQYAIPANELEISFARSSGPGGQNVNKTNTKVSLRWQLSENFSLPLGARLRLRGLAGSRLIQDGSILIVSQEHRDQPQNLKSCYQKLRLLVLQSLTSPKLRRPTLPTKASHRRRMDQKRQTSQRKQGRSNTNWDG